MSDLNENDLILISGGGPAGFGAALAFSNNQYKNIIVLESRPDMNFDEENSYPVGINVRGRNAVKNLYANSSAQLNWDSLGLKVDQWKIIVGPGINVANFDSGLVYGTSRAGVTQLVYDETQRRNSIQVLFGHKTKSIDLKSKSVTCETNTGQTKVYKPACLVVADGYRSRIRDSLAESHKALKVQQWPW
jgi:kynurenine 3-monooxygenase